MSDIITLSSDEEVEEVPIKRIKPTPLKEISITSTEESKGKDKQEEIVVLSDGDDEMEGFNKNSINACNGGIKEHVEPNAVEKDVENDTITFIDDKSKILLGDAEKDEKTGHDGQSKKCIATVDENSLTDSSGKENESENLTLPEGNELEEASSSNDLAHNKLLEEFLNVCKKSISNSRYEHLKDKQFPILRKYYKKCSAKLSESVNFLKLLDENTERAEKSPASAVISFNEIFQHVKELVDAASIEVSEENRLKLKKLEKTIKLLIARIKHLETIEIDFDAEEDSSYLQLDRYINRLNKVHHKYCELLKKNPYSGRITYEKLDFVDSEYNEINRAVSKKYKNNKKFPSYIEMEECIKKVVKEHNLNLSESKIKSESTHCFKKLGELLQNRRKKELYDAHYLYIRDSDDPANKDESLDSALKQNFSEGQIKIEKLCDDYVTKEELGEEVVLSEEDSDKSNYVDSENEEKGDI